MRMKVGQVLTEIEVISICLRARVLLMAALFTTAAFSSSAQPVNDDFTNRVFLTDYTNVLLASTAGATGERGEPNQNFLTEDPSIWYSWTAPAAGTATVYYTGDNYVRYFAVFMGTQLTSLHQMGRTGYGVTFETKPGQVFQIQVMAPTITPDFYVHLDLVPRPLNDNFTNRFQLEGTVVTTNGNNQAATREVGEPRHNGLRFGRSVWYSWTAPASGWMFVDLTNCPPLVCEPYTGDSIRRLRPVNGFLISSNPFSGVIAVQASTDYDLAVDGDFYYDKVVYSGPFTLDIEFSGLTLINPPNDSILDVPPQLELTASDLQPAYDGEIDNVTFYAFDLLANQEMAIGQSAGPGFDTMWTNPTNGYYRIQARGTNSDGRWLRSNPAFIALRPVNDEFTNRIILQGENATSPVNFAAATRSPSDPEVATFLQDQFNGTTLWWSWTAPADGTVTLSFISSVNAYNVALAVYTGHPRAFSVVMKPSAATGQFQAHAGETYQILLADRLPPDNPPSLSQGSMTLTLQP